MLNLFAIVGLCGALLACTGNIPQIPVHAELAGQEIRTTVDSELAKYYLEHYLRGEHVRPALDAAIDAIEHDIGKGIPSRAAFESANLSTSTDLAALLLWQRLSRDPANRQIQRMFVEEFTQLKAKAEQGDARLSADEKSYLMVFAPGWLYKTQPETGSDFAMPRQVLNSAGAKTALLDIDENGTVERNAVLIAEQLIRFSRNEKKIILVSASKAGPEVALALTTLRQTGAAHSVKAWVNIGGVLRGTALADSAMTWPLRWYVKFFIIGGKPVDGIESLTTARSVERARKTALPIGVAVVNYVGIPLSGQVSAGARLGYALLRSEGPNDGLTPIVDEIPANSMTIAELGLDHFFGDPEIHIKTVALAKTVVRYLEDPRADLPRI